MAVETGTAAGYLDLLAKFNTFVTTNATLVTDGENWATEYSDTVGEYAYIWNAPGLDGLQNIYTGIATFSDADSDYYNWRLAGMIGYDSGLSFDLQPGKNPGGSDFDPKMYLTNDAIAYWFIANGQRAIIIARVSTVYQIGYLGYYFPYTTPDQYPYPLMIGGMGYNNLTRWSDTNTVHRFFPDPAGRNSFDTNGANLAVRDAAGNWVGFSNSDFNVYATYPFSINNYDNIASYARPQYIDKWRNGPDGSYALMPIVLTSKLQASGSTRAHWGEVDGVYAVSGYSAASEDIVTINAEDYMIVQNAFRTESDNYVAIKLV